MFCGYTIEIAQYVPEGFVRMLFGTNWIEKRPVASRVARTCFALKSWPFGVDALETGYPAELTRLAVKEALAYGLPLGSVTVAVTVE